MHPGLSDIYRSKVADLTTALNDEACRSEAAQMLRVFLPGVRLIPETDGHSIELVGELAAIMALGDAKTTNARSTTAGGSVTLVAGVGFEPTTFRL